MAACRGAADRRTPLCGVSLMTAIRIPPFVCPKCHGALEPSARAYRCGACATDFPIVLGIPDFRLFPDPWIGFEDDRAKATRLAELIARQGFDEAVRTYWQITPATPRPLAERFTRHVLDGEARASEWMTWLDAVAPAAPDGCWLDIGCGTADMVAAGHERGLTVVGIDIALRWLVVAGRREALAGRTTQLVCANAEHLPFAAGSFVRAVSMGTLEHCRDANLVAAEARRVLLPGGLFAARTVNRYSLLPEPHVGVWGVGFLPRRWADRYVFWRSRQRYEHHHPLSPRELRIGFTRAGFVHVRVDAAALLPSDRGRLGRTVRRVGPLYERLRRLPIVGRIVRAIAPLLDASGVAP